MSVVKSSKARGRTLNSDEFMAKHADELLDADNESVVSGPIPAAWLMHGKMSGKMSDPLQLPMAVLQRQLRRWWLVRLLAAAGTENSPEAYSSLLRFWLHKLEVETPAGVFMPSRVTPGRPRSAKTEKIFLTWIDLGRPPLSSRKLAHAVYKAEFTKANSRERKKMIDQCRRSVERRQTQLRLNPSGI